MRDPWAWMSTINAEGYFLHPGYHLRLHPDDGYIEEIQNDMALVKLSESANRLTSEHLRKLEDSNTLKVENEVHGLGAILCYMLELFDPENSKRHLNHLSPAGNVGYICLPPPEIHGEPWPGLVATIAGWGRIDEEVQPRKPHYASNRPILAHDYCSQDPVSEIFLQLRSTKEINR